MKDLISSFSTFFSTFEATDFIASNSIYIYDNDF